MIIKDDHYFMKKALLQARVAYKKGEVPVGAVVVKDGEIISRGYNLRESTNDPTAHAELLAMKKASKKLNSSRYKCHSTKQNLSLTILKMEKPNPSTF